MTGGDGLRRGGGAADTADLEDSAVSADLEDFADSAVSADLESSESFGGIEGDGGGLLSVVVGALEERKGLDVVVLELAGKADFAECMVLVTGGSRRHLGALCRGVMGSLRDGGWSFVVEGEGGEDWIVVDVMRVVVHVFSRDARTRYDLESLWG